VHLWEAGGLMDIHVISLDRPQNVPGMEALSGGARLIWCVPEAQAADYRAAGAKNIYVGPPGKAAKINLLLDTKPDEWVVITDDDCQKLVRLMPNGQRIPISLHEAAVEYVGIGERGRYGFVAIPDFTNGLYMNGKISTWGRTIGWFAAHAPGFRCRYDEQIHGAEDTDIACQAYLEYGRIARPNWIMGVYRVGGPDSHFLSMHQDWDSIRVMAERYPMLVQWDGKSAKLRYKVVAG
jgi:hypothetical protein